MLIEGDVLKADNTRYADSDLIALANNGLLLYLFSSLKLTLAGLTVEHVNYPGQATLHLQANRDYELTMVNLEMYYSFANIREGDNNSFKWSVGGGKPWTILCVPTACYELKATNAGLIRIGGNSDITILPNVHTLRYILTVVGAKCKVCFDVPNSLASVRAEHLWCWTSRE